jgi:hypothetical protein
LYRPVLRVFHAALFDAQVGHQILEPARLAETGSQPNDPLMARSAASVRCLADFVERMQAKLLANGF